jgi:hypothetical protein
MYRYQIKETDIRIKERDCEIFNYKQICQSPPKFIKMAKYSIINKFWQSQPKFIKMSHIDFMHIFGANYLKCKYRVVKTLETERFYHRYIYIEESIVDIG